MNEKLEDLKIVKNVLDKLKVKFFLNYGTLLGAYRDGDFLESDNDIDLGIFGNERREEILEELKKQGFYLREGKDNGNICVDRKTHFDIHLFTLKGDEYLCGLSNCKFPKEFDKLEKIIFKGLIFFVPGKTEKYLEMSYGDWRNKDNKKQTSFCY